MIKEEHRQMFSEPLALPSLVYICFNPRTTRYSGTFQLSCTGLRGELLPPNMPSWIRASVLVDGVIHMVDQVLASHEIDTGPLGTLSNDIMRPAPRETFSSII